MATFHVHLLLEAEDPEDAQARIVEACGARGIHPIPRRVRAAPAPAYTVTASGVRLLHAPLRRGPGRPRALGLGTTATTAAPSYRAGWGWSTAEYSGAR